MFPGEHVLIRSGHSGCMANHADFVVNGYFVGPSMISDTEVVRGLAGNSQQHSLS